MFLINPRDIFLQPVRPQLLFKPMTHSAWCVQKSFFVIVCKRLHVHQILMPIKCVCIKTNLLSISKHANLFFRQKQQRHLGLFSIQRLHQNPQVKFVLGPLFFIGKHISWNAISGIEQ